MTLSAIRIHCVIPDIYMEMQGDQMDKYESDKTFSRQRKHPVRITG